MVDPDGECPLLLAMAGYGLLNVGIDMTLEYVIQKAENPDKPFQYKWTDGLKAFGQGATTFGLGKLAKANQLGSFAYKLVKNSEWYWKLGRAFTTSTIYKAWDIGVDAAFTDTKIDKTYMNNWGLQLASSFALNSAFEFGSDWMHISPDDAANDLTKKSQKKLEKLGTQFEFYDYHYEKTANLNFRKLAAVDKAALRDLNEVFYRQMRKRIIYNGVLNTTQKIVSQKYLVPTNTNQQNNYDNYRSSNLRPY